MAVGRYGQTMTFHSPHWKLRALLEVLGSRSLPTTASTARLRLPTLGMMMVSGATFSRLPSSSVKACIFSCTASSISVEKAPLKRLDWIMPFLVMLGWAVLNRDTPSALVVE